MSAQKAEKGLVYINLWQEILKPNAENAEEPEKSSFLRVTDVLRQNARLSEKLMLLGCMEKR